MPSQMLVHVIDRGIGAEQATNQFQKGVRAFANTIHPDRVYNGGFRAYVETQGLRDFASTSLNL
jgi:hypothetical protein